VTHAGLNEDFLDLIRALTEAKVDFVIVGAHALAAHGIVRATGDLDLLVRPSSANAQKLVRALTEFGAPLAQHGIAARDFTAEGTVYQMGVPPRRIDLLTSISGVPFREAWKGRLTLAVGELSVGFLGREELLRNKRAAGRPKDLLDVDRLEAPARRRR
jgi:hypothetical protein